MDFTSKFSLHAFSLFLAYGVTLATILECQSPQYIALGIEGIVQCSFPDEFTAIVWYDSLTIDQAHVTRLEKQSDGVLKASGDGYESGSYDILSNGSLVIPSVTIHHERRIKVLLVDKDLTVSETDIALVIVVRPKQVKPKVSSCEAEVLCLTSSSKNDTLDCTLNQARPAANLSWHRHHDGKKNALESMTNITMDGHYTFTSTSSVDISQFTNNGLIILSCTASGPALDFKQAATKVVVYNMDTHGKSKSYKNMLQRTAVINTSLDLPCTEEYAPVTYVWSFEGHNTSSILAFSVQGEKKLIGTLHHEFDVLQDGTITFESVDYLLEGVFICTYLDDGESSFSKVRVKIVENRGKGLPISSASGVKTIFPICIVVLGVCGISAWYIRRKLMDRPLTVYKEYLNSLLNWPIACDSDKKIYSEETIDLLRKVSKEADSNRKIRNYASAAGAAASAAGGVVAVAGTILLPFTLGASAVMIGIGAATGLTGASVNAGFSIDKLRQDKKRLKRVKPSFERFISVQNCLSKAIVYIAIAYDIMDFFQKEKNKITKEILSKISREINQKVNYKHGFQHSGDETVETNIENVMQHANDLVSMSLKFIKERDAMSDNLTTAVDDWEKRLQQAEECPFDILRESAQKVNTCGKFGGNIFTFFAVIKKIYAEDLTPSKDVKMNTAVLIGKTTASTAATATRVALQTVDVGDDVTKVGLSVAKLAQGVAVAGVVLGLVGIAVDIAFLGKALSDIKTDKKEDLCRALDETADVMEDMNTFFLKESAA